MMTQGWLPALFVYNVATGQGSENADLLGEDESAELPVETVR